jgi:cysteine desulfurase
MKEFSMDRIYLDYAATTPVDPRVVEAMEPFFTTHFGNASSVHAAGREAKTALESARTTIARAIGAQPAEVVFTSGGTESDNAAIAGIFSSAPANAQRGVVTAAAEHHAVLSLCEEYEQSGRPVSVLPVDCQGVIDRDALRSSLAKHPLLISVMYANNEVGAIVPLREIAEEVHAAGAVLHSDAVQCLGKIPLDVNALGVDLMSLTAHKLYGPKGIGALYIRNGIPWRPFLYGGGQERGRRPGTENVALAVGFARAVELALSAMPHESVRLSGMRDDLEKGAKEMFPGVLVNSGAAVRLPNILNISFDSAQMPMEGEMLLTSMDLKGIALSSGSACTSGSVQPSHVLLAMGRDPQTARASLRFSFGRLNTPEDIPLVLSALREVVALMTSGS